mgnify:CR=1 FL=1
MISGGSPFSRLDTVPVTGSTQDDLRAALTGPERASWPHLSALRALAQTAGRGRSGRAWVTPDDGGALLVSVVLRPLVPVERLAWLPLLGGLAVRDALAPLVEGLPWCVGTKWPNDVVALPDDPAAFVMALAQPGWFETVALSAEDRERSRHYAENARRAELREAAVDMDAYLASLGMTASVGPTDALHLPRFAQLINKSNQFHLTGTRYAEAEVFFG